LYLRADSQRDDNYAHSIVSGKIESIIELIFKIVVKREEPELETKRCKRTDIYNIFNCMYVCVYIYIKFIFFDDIIIIK